MLLLRNRGLIVTAVSTRANIWIYSGYLETWMTFMARRHLYIHSNFKVWSFVNDCILFLCIFVWLVCMEHIKLVIYALISCSISPQSSPLSISVSGHWFLRPSSYTPESGPASARLGWYAWVWKMQFTDVMLNISWYWISLRLLPYLYPRSEGYSFAALSRLKVCFCARSVFEGEELQFI